MLKKILNILQTYFDLNQKEKESNHTDFLDGYRGSLVLWVFFHHCHIYFKLGCDMRYFSQTGYYIGVVGFFVLSSYLLTYRLLHELNEKKNSMKKICLVFFKYFVRRLFRIYLPFVVTCVLIKKVSTKIGGPHNYNGMTLYGLFTLKDGSGSHLWTIAPEIKYYFFIPIFVFFSQLMNRNNVLKIFWLIGVITSLFIAEHFKLLVQLDSSNNFTRHESELLTRFSTFFLGSILGLIMNTIDGFEYIKKLTEHNLIKFVLALASFIMYLIGMVKYSAFFNSTLNQNRDLFSTSLYWSIFFLMFVVSGRNLFTDIFKIRLLRLLGKFSFGFYLYHMGVIDYVNENYKLTFSLESLFVLSAFVGSFSAGYLFYYILEKNLMNIANFICNNLTNICEGKKLII